MTTEPRPDTGNEWVRFSLRTFLVCAIVLFVAFVAAIVVIARDVLLLVLLAILLAVGLCRLATMIPDRKWLPHSARVGIVMVLLAGFSLVFVGSFGMQLEQQYQGAKSQIAKSMKIFGDGLDDHPNLKTMLGFGNSGDAKSEKKDSSDSEAPETKDSGPTTDLEPSNQTNTEAGPDSKTTAQPGDSVGQMMDIAENHLTSSGIPEIDGFSEKIFAGLSAFFSTSFGFLANLFFVVLIGALVAVNPTTYRNGLLALIPKQRAAETAVLLDDLYDTTWHWMIGRMATMTLTGAGTGIVLAIIGVPMAFLLGVVTALLTFIPNIGAILALVLAILFAAPMGVGTVIAVVVAYMIVQFIESNLITPFVMQHQVAVAPGLLISFQLVMAATLGILGVMVAEPLIAILLVVIRRLYIEKSLEQDLDTNSEPASCHAA